MVNAIVRSGNMVYFGGSFTYAGPNHPYGSAIDTETGTPNFSYATPNGKVFAAVSDGTGGWYIGGNFTSVGGLTRNRIAQLDASGAVTAFNPNANSDVTSLAVSGTTVYAGGSFTSVGGLTRNRIAALDAATGTAVGTFNPNADRVVNSLAVVGTRVYIGGFFSTIGGQARNCIAALDATTGTLVTTFNIHASGTVSALAVAGTTLYAGGDFISIGGQPRSNIAAFDATTGRLVTAYNPNANGSVSSLLVSGTTLYAGGDFTSIGGQARSRIAALDATTGTALSTFRLVTGNSGNVYALALSGTTVYAGGSFSTVNRQAHRSLVVLNAVSGIPLPVELSSFTVTSYGDAVRLAWTTSSEKNSARFEVERSLNGRVFAAIGTVAAAGNSSASRTYTFRDTQAPPVTLYYRLRQVDMDGAISFSPVRVVRWSGTSGEKLILSPNPGRVTTLAGAAPGATVAVYDTMSRQVLIATANDAGQTALILPIGLASGVYVVRTGAQIARLVVE